MTEYLFEIKGYKFLLLTAQSQMLKTRKIREAEAAARRARISKVVHLIAVLNPLESRNILDPGSTRLLAPNIGTVHV